MMKSYKLFTSNKLNTSRSTSTVSRRILLQDNDKTTITSSFIKSPSNQSTCQNPLILINESQSKHELQKQQEQSNSLSQRTKDMNFIIQFNKSLIKLPQMNHIDHDNKNRTQGSLIKKKLKYLKENYKHSSIGSNTTAYLLRKNNSNSDKCNRKGKDNDGNKTNTYHDNSLLLESTQCCLTNRTPLIANMDKVKRMISKDFRRKLFNKTRTKSNLTISNPTIKKIISESRMHSERQGQRSLLAFPRNESRNEQAKMNISKGSNISNATNTNAHTNNIKKQNHTQVHQGQSTNQFKRNSIIDTLRAKDLASVHNNSAQLEIADNILKAYRGKSKAGKNENNMSKMNQDSYLFMTSLFNMIDFNVFGVFDGHGINGHLVSDFIKEYFKQALLKHKDLSSLNSIEDFYNKLTEHNHILIHNLFKSAEANLYKESFDSHYSGTTAVIVFHIGYHIICAYVGDSRAILIEEDKKNCSSSYQVIPLSFDHKPQLYLEKKRIEKAGGRVDQYSELGIRAGPSRVWLKKENYPGLAMSRTIGDLVASSIGVIAVPDIVEYNITAMTKYVIIASDGVWELIDNEKAMNATKLFYLNNNAEGLCSNLIYEATCAWEKEDNVIDDITVVTLFF